VRSAIGKEGENEGTHREDQSHPHDDVVHCASPPPNAPAHRLPLNRDLAGSP
jgi:hypothetical protein